MSRRTEGSRLWSQWLLTAASIGGLVAAGEPGGGRLTLPPLVHPMHVLSWWSSTGPECGSMSILRLIGLLVGGYWLLLCSTVIVARSCGRIVWLARLRLPGTARLVRSAAGASMLGVAVLAAGACGPGSASRIGGGQAPTPPVLVPLAGAPGDGAAGATTTTLPPAPGPGTTPPAESPPQPAPGPLTHATAGTAPSAGIPASTSSVPATARDEVATLTRWTVRPGDDLWSISESVLAARLGHPPDERAVASLWLQVIDANRESLADPENPNLIFAGEVVLVPG